MWHQENILINTRCFWQIFQVRQQSETVLKLVQTKRAESSVDDMVTEEKVDENEIWSHFL